MNNAPVKPRAPIYLFADDHLQQVKNENPHLRPYEARRLVNEMWRASSYEVHLRYRDKYHEAQRVYENALESQRDDEQYALELTLEQERQRYNDFNNRVYALSRDIAVLQQRRPQPALQKQKKPVPAHMLAVLLKASPEDRECPICKDTIDSDMYMTPCFHLFHLACVEKCDKCPMCREKI